MAAFLLSASTLISPYQSWLSQPLMHCGVYSSPTVSQIAFQPGYRLEKTLLLKPDRQDFWMDCVLIFSPPLSFCEWQHTASADGLAQACSGFPSCLCLCLPQRGGRTSSNIRTDKVPALDSWNSFVDFLHIFKTTDRGGHRASGLEVSDLFGQEPEAEIGPFLS